jgi:hypothetical protein
VGDVAVTTTSATGALVEASTTLPVRLDVPIWARAVDQLSVPQRRNAAWTLLARHD